MLHLDFLLAFAFALGFFMYLGSTYVCTLLIREIKYRRGRDSGGSEEIATVARN